MYTEGYIWVFLSHEVFPTLVDYDYSDKKGHSAVHQISFFSAYPQSGDLYVGVYGSTMIESAASVYYDIVIWLSDF